MRDARLIVALVVSERGALAVANHVGHVSLAEGLVAASVKSVGAGPALVLVAPVQAAQSG